MSLFVTKPEQKVKLYQIATAMHGSGLPAQFIEGVVRIASESQGAFELAEMWFEPEEGLDREAVIADLQEMIDEDNEATSRVIEKPKIHFDQLDDIVAKIRKHKEHLRILIDQHGGVSEVARKSGIPQPSLSRMLSSGSMPRRTTLYRIAKALDLSETDIITDWVR